MLNRQNGASYRFGFNGQEKDNEIEGDGNLNTAKFWEYDTRLGRRWNLDPKPDTSMSNYAVFSNSPILHNDVLGDTVVASLFNRRDFLKDLLYGNNFTSITDNLVKKQSVDGIFIIAAHGNSQEIRSSETLKDISLNTVTDFDNYMKVNVPGWEIGMKGNKHMTLLIFACSTGAGENSIAQQISKAHPNLTVVAPDAFVIYRYNDKTNKGYLRVDQKGDKTQGHFMIFEKGKKVGTSPKNKIDVEKVKK